MAAGLAGCGGGSSGSSSEQITDKPQSSTEAARFLTQATFGPKQADIDRLNQLGYSRWIDEQLAMSPQQPHTALFDQRDVELKRDDANGKARGLEFLQSFYTRALTDPAQLKHRLAFALSEIFVVSMQDSTLGDSTRMVASYLDMLTDKGTGSYRSLLEGVALHPAMGVYLSSRGNQKEDATSGRVPDENFAREVMQLFSIGLYQLNLDGSLKKSGGQPIETYTGNDIKGLAKVFTGFSWYASDGLAGSLPAWKCFYYASDCRDPNALIRPMRAYPEYHSTSEKRFLNVVIASGSSDPNGDLKKALDALAAHPNVAPFISKQLIQRLVTSNPSPAYVERVAKVFNSTGGNLGATVKAILLDTDARSQATLADPGFGKLREPVLRLTALLRAFKHSSDSMAGARYANDLATGMTRAKVYSVGVTDDSNAPLGQTPLRSPSVFNFYRPGYVPPQTQVASQGLVAPEMQIVNETTIAGYVNYLNDILNSGLGNWKVYDNNGDGRIITTADPAHPDWAVDTQSRRDVQFDFASEMALVDKPTADAPNDLIERVNQLLLQGRMSAGLRSQLVSAIGGMRLTARNSSGSNQATVDLDRKRRVQAAIFLVMVSPEFLVQK